MVEKKPGWFGQFFATKVQTNSLIVNLTLVGIQAYILYELNGKLYDVLVTAEPITLGTIFAPTIALVWVSKRYANQSTNYEE